MRSLTPGCSAMSHTVPIRVLCYTTDTSNLYGSPKVRQSPNRIRKEFTACNIICTHMQFWWCSIHSPRIPSAREPQPSPFSSLWRCWTYCSLCIVKCCYIFTQYAVIMLAILFRFMYIRYINVEMYTKVYFNSFHQFLSMHALIIRKFNADLPGLPEVHWPCKYSVKWYGFY